MVRELAPDLPPVWADGDQLHQVFANLFVNAQQALQNAAGPRRLRITTGYDADSVWVEVADNGPGIPADIAKRIFDPFFTTKPQGVGTGVGLSVCHGILAAHDGEITLKSVPGAGRGVPRAAAPLASTRARRSQRRRTALPRRRGRILVVDDEPDIGQLLAEILERDGHRVERALSGRDALARLGNGRGRPDHQRPADAGHGRARRSIAQLARERPELAPRMVFVTGDTLGADLTGFLSEIGARVMEKPLDPEEISRKVQTLLATGGGA